MNETLVTIIGNVVDNPRLRRTDKGADVASFRVGSTARRMDKETNEWMDGPRVFVSVSCWRQLAVNVAGSLRRGDPVVVMGRLSTKEYEKDGQKRNSIELDANAVGHDLARGTSDFRRSRTELTPTFEVVGGTEQATDSQRPQLRAVPDLEPELVAVS